MANINDTGKITYSIVGRYMNASAVSAYHIIGSDGKELKASRELVCYLVGKGLVTNCKGQMNGGDIALRGVGVNLTDLPVKNERTGEIRRNNATKTSDTKMFVQLRLVASIYQDSKCIGYVVRDAGGTEKKLAKSVVFKLAASNKVVNAELEKGRGEPYLKGVDIDLDKLPIIDLDNRGVKSNTNNKTKASNVENIKSIKVDWYSIEKLMLKLESKFNKDAVNNASGVYQYPVIELMDSHSAVMRVVTDKGVFRVNQVRKGITNKDYGLDFIMSSNGDKVRVVCDDISILVFNIHVLGFMAITALLKIDRELTIREFVFENKLERLIWREYTTIKNTDTFKIDVNKALEISKREIMEIQSEHDIGLSPLSNLGDRRRYPTVGMIANQKAIMGINTSKGYYEANRIKYGIKDKKGIAIELVKKARGNNNSHVITMLDLDKSEVTTKNISLIVCAALFKLDGNIDITDVVIENQNEQSVLGYTFNKKVGYRQV